MPQPVSRPDISIDPPPSLVWPIYPDKPSISIPNMKDVVLGAMLQYVIPDVPTVIDPTLPTPPQMITINPTDWNFAIDNILVSDDPMVQAVMDRLRRNILHGGTGLSPDIEAAIWNRGSLECLIEDISSIVRFHSFDLTNFIWSASAHLNIDLVDLCASDRIGAKKC